MSLYIDKFLTYGWVVLYLKSMRTTKVAGRDTVRITAYLPVETAQVLESLKKGLGVSYSKIIEKALKKYLKENKALTLSDP